MRKVLKVLLAGLAVTALAAVVVLPVAVPPLVENLVCDKLHGLGLPGPRAKMNLGYCWRNGPGVCGDLRVSLLNTPWRVNAKFAASCCEWSVAATMPEVSFDERDAVLQALLRQHPVTAVSNLVFSGSVALDAKAERTFRKPVPVWSAKLPIRDLSLSLMAKGKPYSVTGFSVTPAASGIADHVDIRPAYPWAKAVSAAGFELSDFFAAVRVSEKAVLVTEASAGFCGGQVNLYSAFLDPKNLNTGLTLFLNDVHAGEALALFRGFSGEASGRLHGKVRLFLLKGESVRLSDAFLYSTPGEIGKLRLTDPASVTDGLSLAGFDEAAQANVADALTDLDYSVLRLNLKRGEGKSATLSTTIRGSATRGQLTVPVDLTLNVNGELEQLVNAGLSYSKLLKGTKP